MTWTAIWSNKARKELDKLPKDDIKRVLLKTGDVEVDPFSYLERLESSHFFKYRVGKYRIIVDVINDKLILYMLKVKKRSRVYDRYDT